MEADLVEGEHRAEVFGQPVDVDHEGSCLPPAAAPVRRSSSSHHKRQESLI
jgi:hypothetical protein